jgi:hypothetical protein
VGRNPRVRVICLALSARGDWQAFLRGERFR